MDLIPYNRRSFPGSCCAAPRTAPSDKGMATDGAIPLICPRSTDCPVPVHLFPDDRFFCSHAEFTNELFVAKGREMMVLANAAQDGLLIEATPRRQVEL